MPDSGGTVTDHDVRLVAKVQPTAPTTPIPFKGMFWYDGQSCSGSTSGATSGTDGTSGTSPTISDDSITYTKLGSEFKTVVELGVGVDINWSLGSIFTKTLTSAPTYIFSNLRIGKIIIKTTGDYSPTFPSGFIYGGGTRAAIGITRYILTCDDTSTPSGYYVILKDES